jgi:superkiller protein 3
MIYFNPRFHKKHVTIKEIKIYLDNSIGICYYKLANFENAMFYFLKHLDKHKDSSILICIADILDRKAKRTVENLNTQISCLKSVIRVNPGNVTYPLRLAKLYIEIKDLDLAIEEYNKVLEINPKIFDAMFELTCLYLVKKDFENLAQLYLRIGNMLKESLAHDIYDASDPNSTINICLKYYIEAQKLIPNNIDIILSLADIHRISNKPKEALSYINLALQMDKKDYRVYYQGFLIYEDIGDTHTAKEMIKVCLMLNIGFIKGYNAFGNLLRKEKLYNEALMMFEAALLHDDNNIMLLNNYANCLLEMGKKKKAKEIYLRAHHIDNSLPDINSNLATIYRKESK